MENDGTNPWGPSEIESPFGAFYGNEGADPQTVVDPWASWTTSTQHRPLQIARVAFQGTQIFGTKRMRTSSGGAGSDGEQDSSPARARKTTRMLKLENSAVPEEKRGGRDKRENLEKYVKGPGVAGGPSHHQAKTSLHIRDVGKTREEKSSRKDLSLFLAERTNTTVVGRDRPASPPSSPQQPHISLIATQKHHKPHPAMTSPCQRRGPHAADLERRRRTSVSSDHGSIDTGTSEQKSTPQSTPPPASPEFDLLDEEVLDGFSHEQKTAPLVTRDAYNFPNSGLPEAVPQYGLLGSIISIFDEDKRELVGDRRLYLNTNAPFSAVVCGVQGSGKSHTVGVMLESMLIPNEPRLGALTNPLAALVLHFGESGGGAQPCEAAFQCVSIHAGTKPPKVRVFVSPSQLGTMEVLYWKKFGDRVEVLPLKITHDELDASGILAMMSVSSSHEPPLYVHIIMNILRDLGERFTYTEFRYRVSEEARTFNPQQKSGFQQRMSLLESFLEPRTTNTPRFKKGEITIVDLTDPFIDAASACSLFEIVTRIFVRADVEGGKVLLVDEAHKYLTRERGSQVLTKTLLSIVRQQRHLGMRLIISTQEPTVIPEVLLDLCTITIMHRFSSISWFTHLSQHVSSQFNEAAFDTVVKLETGQAIVLAPAGLGVFPKRRSDVYGVGEQEVAAFGRRYLITKTRKRVTADGGASILAT